MITNIPSNAKVFVERGITMLESSTITKAGIAGVALVGIGYGIATIVDSVKGTKTSNVTLEYILNDYIKKAKPNDVKYSEFDYVPQYISAGTIRFNDYDFKFRIKSVDNLIKLSKSHTLVDLEQAICDIEIDNVSEMLKARLTLYIADTFNK